jgi:hypothetical protein
MPYKYDPETGLILHWKAVPEYFGDYGSAPTGTIINGSAYANTSTNVLYQYISGSWTAIYNLSALAAEYLLLETADKMLLETGEKVLLE